MLIRLAIIIVSSNPINFINAHSLHYKFARRGGSRISIGGGGGAQKILCAHAHHDPEARSSLRPGPGPAF